MPTPILMPRQGQSVESCILVRWNVQPGDHVDAGAMVAEIETDKATFEVESPVAGTLLELFFEEGDDIPVLTHIAAVGDPGEDPTSLRPGATSEVPEEATHPTPSAGPAPVQSPDASAAPVLDSKELPSGDPAAGVSPRARQAATKAGLDAHQLTGTGPGGRVIERDVIAAAASTPPLTPAAHAAMSAGHLEAPLAGSGPGGRIRVDDLQPADADAAPPPPAPGTTAEPREIPVTGIRKIIAQRMMASLGGTAQLTLNRRFDASAIQGFRRKVKSMGDPFGLAAVSINDLIVFATAKTLLRHPELNAHFLGDKILCHGHVNLGIAVDTPRGLMVPVLRNAQAMSLQQVATGIRPLAKACQQGTILPDHLTGGTFTVTNLGSMGIETFTPVLNAPEVAILGVGSMTVQPVRTDKGISYIDAIQLSLTIDHQAVDGAPAARFLKDLASALENIELLLAT